MEWIDARETLPEEPGMYLVSYTINYLRPRGWRKLYGEPDFEQMYETKVNALYWDGKEWNCDGNHGFAYTVDYWVPMPEGKRRE